MPGRIPRHRDRTGADPAGGQPGWWYFDGKLFMTGGTGSAHRRSGHSAIAGAAVRAFTGRESASVATAVAENTPQRRNRDLRRCTDRGAGVRRVVHGVDGHHSRAELAALTRRSPMRCRLMLGPLAAGTIALAALIKATGTLGGWILLTAQTGKAGADRGQFPQALRAVSIATACRCRAC